MEIIKTPGCEGKDSLRVYCDASIGVTPGLLRTKSLYDELTLDADQADMMVAWLVIENNKDKECDLLVYTDRLMIVKRFAEGKISCNSEVDIWGIG